MIDHRRLRADSTESDKIHPEDSLGEVRGASFLLSFSYLILKFMSFFTVLGIYDRTV